MCPLSKRGDASGSAEWGPHDLVALLAEQTRQLDGAHQELRAFERRAVCLDTENTHLRAKVRDLQNVLRAMTAAVGESISALTMPDTTTTSERRREPAAPDEAAGGQSGGRSGIRPS